MALLGFFPAADAVVVADLDSARARADFRTVDAVEEAFPGQVQQ